MTLPTLNSPPPLWRQVQRESICTLEQLYSFLALSPEEKETFANRTNFPILIPKRLAEKIDPQDPRDPILQQFVPIKNELHSQEGYVCDPLNELEFQKTPKLLQKYKQRVLLVPTSACAMHCRYCFRQHYPYLKDKQFHKELEIIANNPELAEVILSGGDPLSLSNEELHALVVQLEKIPHITRLRWHTRFPIGIPERIDEHFLSIIKNSRFQMWWVFHINHAKELDEDIIRAIKKLRCAGGNTLAQAVLLKGVNDNTKALFELSEALSNAGICFYYLHQLDPVQGASHFWVDPKQAKKILEELRTLTSGYGIPLYVQEQAHQPSKTPL